MPLMKEFDVQDDCLIVRLTGDLDHGEAWLLRYYKTSETIV